MVVSVHVSVQLGLYGITSVQIAHSMTTQINLVGVTVYIGVWDVPIN